MSRSQDHEESDSQDGPTENYNLRLYDDFGKYTRDQK